MSKKIMIEHEKFDGIWKAWLERKEVYCVIAAFILGQAVVIDQMRPFALAFLVAMMLIQRYWGIATFIGLFASICIGQLTEQGICTLFIAILLMGAFLNQKIWLNRSQYISVIVVMGINFICKLSFYSLPMVHQYSLWDIVVDSILVGVFVIAFQQCIHSWKKVIANEVMEPKQWAGWLLVVLVLVLSFSQWTFAGLSAQSILCRIMILFASFWGGNGWGAAMGVLVGIVPSFSSPMSIMPMGYYGLLGLCTDLILQRRKMALVFGFILGNIFLIGFYANWQQMIFALLESSIAIILFLVVPIQKQNIFSQQPICCKEIRQEKQGKIKLEHLGEVFLEISKQLQVVTHKESGAVIDSLESMYQKIYVQVCSQCSRRKVCWEKQAHNTYQEFAQVCNLLESQGIQLQSHFSHGFLSRCSHTARLEVALLNQMELFQQKKYYQKQVSLAQESVSRQLASMGKVVKLMAKDKEYGEKMEHKLWGHCKKERIPVEKIRIFQGEQDTWEIAMELKVCLGQEYCKTHMVNKVSKWLGQEYQLENKHCVADANCQIHLVPKLCYKVVAASAMVAKKGNEVSGDSWDMVEILPGKTAIILSDGMGTGIDAHGESSSAVRLLKRLLASGITDQLALEIVNTVLLLRSDEERFSTIDLAMMDLLQRRLEFIKISAAPSFVKNGETVRYYEGASLPVGILDEVDYCKQEHSLDYGDLLIMMSDGVYEALAEGVFQWLEVIQSLPSEEPQLAAEYLLAVASSQYEQLCKDDLTVVVAQIKAIQR